MVATVFFRASPLPVGAYAGITTIIRLFLVAFLAFLRLIACADGASVRPHDEAVGAFEVAYQLGAFRA